MMSTDKIGLIGLGLLGTAIAERLGGGNEPLVGFDVSGEAIGRFRSVGGEPAGSAGGTRIAGKSLSDAVAFPASFPESPGGFS